MKKRIEVVGAVILCDGSVLCAQRGSDGHLPGMWEFPGGKVELSETPRQALVREIKEELDCFIGVGDEVTTTTYEYEFAIVTLTTFYCELISGSPRLTEHAAVKWLAPKDLGSIEWAQADLPAVSKIRTERAA